MIIKGWYVFNGDYIKSVKFDADKNYQPLDKKVIYDNAPESWDECVWDHGSVKPKAERKKRKVEVVEEPEIHEEITDETSE